MGPCRLNAISVRNGFQGDGKGPGASTSDPQVCDECLTESAPGATAHGKRRLPAGAPALRHGGFSLLAHGARSWSTAHGALVLRLPGKRWA